MKIVTVIEYNGARYHGFQWQANVITVQEEVERALVKLCGEKIRIAAASRTDVGVHARGQVVGFHASRSLPLRTWRCALNSYLPSDIAVKRVYVADDSFNARRDATSRSYRYSILNSVTRSPLYRGVTYHISKPLDIRAMNQACEVLIGKNNLTAFSSVSHVRTVRTVYKAEIYRCGDLVIFDMCAGSFLTHQVRNTVGGLIQVGLGKVSPQTFWDWARCEKRGVVGPTAPAHALCLMRVDYSNCSQLSEEGENENIYS